MNGMMVIKSGLNMVEQKVADGTADTRDFEWNGSAWVVV